VLLELFTMRTLLVCRSDVRCRSFVRELKARGVEVHHVGEPHAALDALERRSFAAVMVDGSSLAEEAATVVRRMRRSDFDEPMVVFNLPSGSPATLASLDAGADDVTPVADDFDELVARLRAVVRRCTAQEGCRYALADLEMDVDAHRVTRAGKPIALTPREMSLLERLMLNPRRVVSRAELAEHVWDRNAERVENLLDVYLMRLRRKIDRDFEPALIHTIKGRGVMLSDSPPALVG
jgi:DNA-binding response OmpR family regulator